MAIPEGVLQQWAGYPGPLRSAAAHGAVKTALEMSGRFGGNTVDVYLQGSYRNYTNTKADSDVDIVVELTSVAEFDTSLLTPWQAQLFWRQIQYSEYDYVAFRADVLSALRQRFGDSVVEHNKAIEVRGTFWRMKVDVLPALQFRRVHTFDGVHIGAHDGVAFRVNGRRVVNWPRQHFANGVDKNERTNEHFKPAVRMMKNARRVASEHGLCEVDCAPSYFLQGLLWNVPDELFTASLGQTYVGVVSWLSRNRGIWSRQNFYCQNGVDLLFGNSPEQWTLMRASRLEDTLIQLWNAWQ